MHIDMATVTDIETCTRRFLLSMNLDKYEMAPSEETYRKVKVHKLDISHWYSYGNL